MERFCGKAGRVSKMESKLFNNAILQDSEKNLTTPFSINDILTKEAKCEIENGMFSSFGAKGFLGKSSGCKEAGYQRKEVKYYDDCNGYSDFPDDGALDMSRKNQYPVTELSGKLLL